MQAQAGNVREHETGTSGDSTLLRRKAEEVLRRRMWISPEQVRVRVDDGTATLTGVVGRRSTARIAARLVAAVRTSPRWPAASGTTSTHRPG
jgi:osmotically-inducible protein OsmY